MDTVYYGWIEIVFSFGIVLAFGVWQLMDLRKLRREREKNERDGQS